ncbi:hypothetical protein [Pseudomonas lurida]|uniref:hypothetical protein n=1 Tax=Pseudomonas lurida TaxID=244566 RepID=UPI00164520E7|nr:hypothetical protein [Pseudomonas lurida]MBC3233982.1 hypothetical protein [Pseudomonas lurida]
MTTKHTPGPWFCGQDGFNLGNGVVYARHSNGSPKDICHLHGWGSDKQADSKLIAAAPDLLEALECLKREVILSDVDMSYIDSHFKQWLDKARAAIDKATA